MIDPAKYCIFTSNYPFIDNDGYMALCCKNLNHKLPYHIRDHKLIDIWNSQEIQAVRDELASGGEPHGCHKCYEPERNGIRSFRQKTLGMINKGVPFQDNKIHAIDLRIGNVCNLACIMCFAGNSNRIYQQLPKMAEHFQWKPGRLEAELEKYSAKNYSWSDDPVAWDNIISGIDRDLRHVYLAGGEPFYLRNFASSVQRIGSIAPDARFVINTNGTRLLREKDIAQFAGLNINIRFSIDGWGKADEFTRQETVWEEKLAVIDQYYHTFKVRVWDITANAFSVRHIPKLIQYLDEKYPLTQIQIRPVVNKQEVLMPNIPDEFKAVSLAFFKQHKHRLEGVDHVIQQMELPYNADPKRKEAMYHFVKYWEDNGTVKLADFDPELSEWLASDK